MAGIYFDALWLLMALPGYALLRRAQNAWLDEGAFAAISASYLATFLLLSPIAMVGYWLRLPIRVLGVALLLLIATAAVDLVRDARKLLASVHRPSLLGVIVLLLLAADYVAGLRAGSYAPGDAHYHIGRIRTLIDNGFVNWDPLVAGHRFDPVYHSNIYHAAIAATSELTGLPAFEGWARMLAVTKILATGAAEALAFALFRSRPLALAAAGCAVVANCSLTMMPFPNQLAVSWLLMFAIARGVDLLDGEQPARAAVGIAAAALVLAQVHALYYAFECLLLGPALLAAALFALARKPTRRWVKVPLWGLLALMVGLPWLGRSALKRGADTNIAKMVAPAAPSPAPEVDDDAPPVEEEVRPHDWRYKGFLLLRNQRLALDPGSILDLRNTRVQLLVALMLAALSRGSRRVYAFIGIVAAGLLVLHVPALCTAAVQVAGSPWIVRRLDAVPMTSALVVVPAVVGLLLLDRGWLRGPAPHVVFALALAYGYVFGTDSGVWTREKYFARVQDPSHLERDMARQARRAELLRRYVPKGAVIATSLAWAETIPEVCDCFPLALPHYNGNHGVDMPTRRLALQQILAPNVANEVRVPLLRQYRVNQIFLGPTRRAVELWAKVLPLTVEAVRDRTGVVIVVDPARPL